MIIKHKTEFERTQPNSLFLHIEPSISTTSLQIHKAGHKTPLSQLTSGSLQLPPGKPSPRACFQMQRGIIQQVF